MKEISAIRHIIRHPLHTAPVEPTIVDILLNVLGQKLREFIRPLDDNDASSLDVLLKTDVLYLSAASKSVEIKVVQGSTTMIHMD
jgi:hypothetical protein